MIFISFCFIFRCIHHIIRFIRFIHIIRFMSDLGHGRNGIIVFDIDQFDALCRPSHDPKIGNLHSDRDPGLVDDHEIVLVRYVLDRNELTCLRRDINGIDSFSTPVGDTIVFQLGSLAISLF